MDKFERHRGGDRYNSSSEEPNHYNSSGRQARGGGGGAPFHPHRPDNYRGGGGGRNSPHDYRSGFSTGGGGRENHRPFDSPPLYGDGGVGGVRPFGDGIGGFRPMVGGRSGGEGFGSAGGGGGRGFRPMRGDGGGGFRPMGGDGGGVDEFQPSGGGSSDVAGFRPFGGRGDGERFRPMGGGTGGFRPMGGGGSGGVGFQSVSGGGSDAGGFPPMGGGGSDGGAFGLDNYHAPPPLTGQKRGHPFSGRERSPGREGASFAKLFVGSVPRTATEQDIRPLFDQNGRVLEVALIKDKRTGQQQGCCFIKYASSEEADRAIRALHNQYTLPGGLGPIQVRYADGERERLGATEYKLFVGSLNKQATEKEVEEIFSPYGRVEDVYLMRDEMKQSRGCGFVKYSQREMALAAINALNGTFTMRGCDQPLTVRFADPKRPRPGESRGGPSFGGPGFGPRFSAPGIRPPPDHGQPLHGPIPPNSWPAVSPRNLGPPSHVTNHGFANQFPGQHRDMAVSSTPGPTIGGIPGNTDGSVPGTTVSSGPTSQLGLPPQVPPYGSKISPVQRSLQSPQHLPSSMQLQPLNVSSFSSAQNLPGSHMQPGQVQIPHSAGQTPYGQATPSQQLPGRNGQLSVPQNQVQHNASPAPGQAPGMANQQPPPGQQLQHHQSQSQLAQMLSQQKQTLQATFQSSQQALNQLQQQVQQLQPSNQSLTAYQGSLAAKQQSPWAGTMSHAAASTPGVQPAGDLATTTTSASSSVPAVAPPTAAVSCNWTEHMSPDGYKYYYNSLTGESKWEKPEELTLFEQQQQQQKQSTQHLQMQSHPLGPSSQQASQIQVQLQVQNQAQLHNQAKPMHQPSQTSYQIPGLQTRQGTKEHGYSQIPAGTGPVNDPARYQQGVQASQEWMWKNKHSGT